jgi:hypothetical protein
MLRNFDDLQKFGAGTFETALSSWGGVAKSAQAIVVEVADYSKKSFDHGTAAAEKLLGAQSIDNAFEVQSSYLKSAFEGFVAEAAKLGGLYADLAKEGQKSFETYVGRVAAK